MAFDSRPGGDFLTINGPTHKVRHVSALIEEMVSCLRRGDTLDPFDSLNFIDYRSTGRGRADPSKAVLVTKKNLVRPRL